MTYDYDLNERWKAVQRAKEARRIQDLEETEARIAADRERRRREAAAAYKAKRVAVVDRIQREIARDKIANDPDMVVLEARRKRLAAMVAAESAGDINVSPRRKVAGAGVRCYPFAGYAGRRLETVDDRRRFVEDALDRVRDQQRRAGDRHPDSIRLAESVRTLKRLSRRLSRSAVFNGSLRTERDANTGDIVFIGLAACYYDKDNRDTEFDDFIFGCIERILPGAFDSAIDRGDDVRLFANHNSTTSMARSPKTMKIWTSPRGLHFRATVDVQNEHARTLASQVERGDVSQCSFAFRITDDDVCYAIEDDREIRYLSNFSQLYEISAVADPAYRATEIYIESEGN